MSLSSPNRIVWNYVAALRRRVLATREAIDELGMQQDVTVCIMLAVLSVETFLNVYVRVIVSEEGFRQHGGGFPSGCRQAKIA